MPYHIINRLICQQAVIILGFPPAGEKFLQSRRYFDPGPDRPEAGTVDDDDIDSAAILVFKY